MSDFDLLRATNKDLADVVTRLTDALRTCRLRAEQAEADAAAMRQAIERFLSDAHAEPLELANAIDGTGAGKALLAELEAGRNVIMAVRALALNVPLFEHRSPLQAALDAYDEAVNDG